MVAKARVVVIVDWPHRQRRVGWSDALRSAERQGKVQVLNGGPTLVSLAAETSKVEAGPSPAVPWVWPERQFDILIVNWDAANSDPWYGSHLTLECLRHFRSDILAWVETGGVLVLDGQTAAHRPVQEAYDAVLGSGELRLDKMYDIMERRRFHDLLGYQLQLDAGNRDHPLIAGLSGDNFCARLEERDELAQSIYSVAPIAAEQAESASQGPLYRGWFKKRPQAIASRLRWRTLAWSKRETHPKRRPILLCAPHGKGAIVASTMMLGYCVPPRFVSNLFGLVDKGVPPREDSYFAKSIPYIVPSLAGPLVGLVAGLLGLGTGVSSVVGGVTSALAIVVAWSAVVAWRRWQRARRVQAD